jgi:Domain of unknown function (DUF4397)
MRCQLSLPRRLPTLVIALGCLAGSSTACTSHDRGAQGPQGSIDSGDDGGPAAPGTDAGIDGSGDDGASPPPQTSLRIAHASPDMPPIDICVAAHGTTDFQGPLVGQLVDAIAGDAGEDAEGDAGLSGVAYGQVSAYLQVDPTQLDVRIVAAGAGSCAVALVPDSTDLPPLAFETYTTLLVAGELSPAGTDSGVVVAMLSDDAVLAGGAASLRAINAMPSEPFLDFGMQSSTTEWVPLFTDVPFAASSMKTNPDDDLVDRNGYVPIAPFSGQGVSARPSSSDASAASVAAGNVTIDFGSIATVVAIGGKTGESAHPPSLLLCTDNQPAGGVFADCSVLQ